MAAAAVKEKVQGLRISEFAVNALRCPKCRSPLSVTPDTVACRSASCIAVYPVVHGVPVLINEERSVVSVSDFTGQKQTTFHRQPGLQRFFSRIIPELGVNRVGERNYRKLKELLTAQNASPKVLVVGCGETGRGMKAITAEAGIELINTDVWMGPFTEMVCDAHDLPFADHSFDGAVVQAVLEHVADPPRCTAEIHRVTKPGGLIYAETPFIQQVHGGPYDFTRYTHLGHRRLFRGYDEIESGATSGPGTALAWSYQYFLLSFVRSNGARAAVKAFARLTSFWLRVFDHLILETPGTLDAASGYYFMGRKSEGMLTDRELIRLYRGAGETLPASDCSLAP